MRKQLAALIVTALASGLSVANAASDAPLNISLGMIRTEAEQGAIGFIADYFKTLSVEKFKSGDNYLIDISPELKIQTGEKDSFNGLIAKIKGYNAFFQTETLPSGAVVVNSNKLIHLVPLSAGIETNKDFSNINTLVELGYVPFLRLADRYIMGINPVVGVFAQAGYKFKTRSNSEISGGAADKSKEDPNSPLARLKFGGKSILPITYLQKDKYQISVIPEAWGWYDVVNNRVYYQAVGIVRLGLDESKNFDLKYEKGSGAPNFNTGDQFSANITVTF